MKARFIAAALAGLCATASIGASAAPYHVVYDALITDGSDADNLFGLSGQSLVNMAIRADVTYSTSVAGTRMTMTDFDEVTGGEAFGTDPVISSAIFTIGTRSVSILPTYYGDVYSSADYLSAYGYDELGNNFQTYILPNLAGPTNLQALFSSAGVGDNGGRITQYSNVIIGNDLIDFNAINVNVSAVPESSTWFMMLFGFGGIGLAMRQRRKVYDVAAA